MFWSELQPQPHPHWLLPTHPFSLLNPLPHCFTVHFPHPRPSFLPCCFSLPGTLPHLPSSEVNPCFLLSDLSFDNSDLVMLKSLLAGLNLPSRDGRADEGLDEEGEGNRTGELSGGVQGVFWWVSLSPETSSVSCMCMGGALTKLTGQNHLVEMFGFASDITLLDVSYVLPGQVGP